jgi:hypothetical protein
MRASAHRRGLGRLVRARTAAALTRAPADLDLSGELVVLVGLVDVDLAGGLPTVATQPSVLVSLSALAAFSSSTRTFCLIGTRFVPSSGKNPLVVETLTSTKLLSFSISFLLLARLRAGDLFAIYAVYADL